MKASAVLPLVLCLGAASCADTAAKAPATPHPGSVAVPANVAAAGVRSSIYGIKPFPSPAQWGKALEAMQAYYPGSRATAIWIVGVMDDEEDTCRLEFPGSSTDKHLKFSDSDRHEKYLSYFDEAGVDVYLQVEPGQADMPKLIDLVMDRYGAHPCVKGFGVDVEWYKVAGTEGFKAGYGTPVTDQAAREWEARIQAKNPRHGLFLKHWDPAWMPPTYRGSIIFVSDSQEFASAGDMVEEFAGWGETFAPNDVWYQIGYPADRSWWTKYGTAPRDLGSAIASRVEQRCGVMWVDFTLKQVLPLN